MEMSWDFMKRFGKKSYANDRRRFNRILKKAGIPFTCYPLYDGYKWEFPDYPSGDVIIHSGSYACKFGWFESMGFPWDGEDVAIATASTLARNIKTLIDLGKWDE